MLKHSLQIARNRGLILLATIGLLAVCLGQQGGKAEPLSIHTVNPAKAFLRQPYRYTLAAQGGTPPLAWQVTDGSLPAGIALSRDGILSGVPAQAGVFQFVATVTDNISQRSLQLTLEVIAPVLAQWKVYPKVIGHRVEGVVEVSNQTDHDFDLTFIVLAVNETGRATAIGYQRFALKKNMAGYPIPFGDNLPQGVYQINVDAVAEVAEIHAIYRARLVEDKLRVLQEP